MIDDMPTVYEPKEVEKRANELWISNKCFDANPPESPSQTDRTFTIVIPPPNVTAALHLGHALNNTLQDILIRFRRMQQYNTLWMPGTDHAGIATQTVVEKRILAEEGKRRTDFERDEFVARVQAWKDEYEAQIINQLKLMGCSCDWRRTRFTMDEVCAKAVRTTFFKLFKDGLIYRGKRLVNWDPATQTVLADDEVEHETVQGHFWYLRYPLVEPVVMKGEKVEYLTVATTRPETMLGDTAVAMNPSDPRAKFLIGKQVRLPLVGRIIPIIPDDHVVLPDAASSDDKAKFSTGFLKVTPAHDPDDWEIGQRHNLPVINVMAPDGSISDQYGWPDAQGTDAKQFLGMDRFEACKAIVEWFRQEELLEEVREYAHEVGHSYRSHVPIEPYLSDQWYIAVKKPIEHLAEKFDEGLIKGTDVPVNSLAGLALKPLLDGRLRFIPERYAKTYQAWLENLRDWPISRQLWWGHQIPVWSSKNKSEDTSQIAVQKATGENGETIYYVCVGPDCEDTEKQLEADGWQRDLDVLDTWFSSALWPFSTMGWPDDTPLMKTYYPGSVLCTAREIITLWVSRMVMMGQYCAGDIPFSDVFIHAMIQDGQGRKMSKSLGNGIDPLVAIDSHGADAMRFALTSMTTQTQDVRMPVEPMELPDGRVVNTSPKFDLGRNFCNKLWNASRFALGNLQDMTVGKINPDDLKLEDKWILSRLARAIETTTSQLEEFKFSEPINTLYRFFWNELCDWYLELIKPRMRDEVEKPLAQRVLAYVMDACLRLFHPFLPFITEGIYQQLNAICPRRGLDGIVKPDSWDNLIQAKWPEPIGKVINEDVESRMELVQTTIKMIRDLRTQYQVVPRKALEVAVKTNENYAGILSEQAHLICNLANLSRLEAGTDCAKPENAATAVSEGLELYVSGVIDVEAEQKRLLKKKDELGGAIKGSEGKLNNENFVTKAKPEVVQRERDRLEQLKEQLASVQKNLDELIE
ncbi:MAG: valine--tRNA ligase [Sedimentisphaerales bacterium]|nr:valine--tRNA ligase [Sedimentisphaerales bacterium]